MKIKVNNDSYEVFGFERITKEKQREEVLYLEKEITFCTKDNLDKLSNLYYFPQTKVCVKIDHSHIKDYYLITDMSISVLNTSLPPFIPCWAVKMKMVE